MKHIPFLTLSGASGAGKTTLMEELVTRFPDRFRYFPSVTTRSPRPSDKQGSFIYLSPEEFAEWEKTGKFKWVVEYSGNKYGTANKNIKEAIRDPQTSILPIVPKMIPVLRALVGNENIICLYIPTLPESVMHQRLKLRGESEDTIKKRIAESAAWDKEAYDSSIPYHFLENTGTVDELVAKALAILEVATTD